MISTNLRNAESVSDGVFTTHSYNSGEQLFSYNTKKISHKYSVSEIVKSISKLSDNKFRNKILNCF